MTTSIGPGTYTAPQVQTSNTNMPLWADQANQQVAGAATGALNQLQQTPWYGGPLQAGLTPEQQGLINAAPGAAGAWKPYFAEGMARTNEVEWDPAEMQRHLNPYLSGVNDEIARRGGINFKAQLEQLNPAFTGGGAFGSSRWQQANADLAGANQRDILGTQATAMNQAYNQAATDYLGWGQLEQKGAADMFQAGTAAQTNAWGDIQNPYKMQELYRQNTQEGLDKSKADWLEQLKFPAQQLGGLSQIVNQTTQPYSRNMQQTNTTSPTAQPSWVSDLMTILGQFGDK